MYKIINNNAIKKVKKNTEQTVKNYSDIYSGKNLSDVDNIKRTRAAQ